MSQPRPVLVSLALLVAALGAALPAHATAPVSLQLPAQHRLLDTKLKWLGSGGDAPASAPLMDPMLGAGLAGLGAGLLTVPLISWASVALRNDSPDLVPAAVPLLLLFMAVPAAGVTMSEWAVGRALGADLHIQPAIYVGLGVQLIAFVVGAVTNVGPSNFGSMALFTAVDAVVLAGAVWGTMKLQTMLSAPKPTTAVDVVLPPTSSLTDRVAKPTRASGISLFAGAF